MNNPRHRLGSTWAMKQEPSLDPPEEETELEPVEIDPQDIASDREYDLDELNSKLP